jgi:predicted nucleotidyltransferase
MPPQPSEVLNQNRERIRTIVSLHHTSNPRDFGSLLRRTDEPGSDLDLLVDPLPGATLFDLGGLQVALEEMLGVPVDVLTPGDLPKKFREQILREAMPV